MSVYYKNGKISEEGINKQIDFLKMWISEQEKSNMGNKQMVFKDYSSVASDYGALCAAYLYLGKYEGILEYRKKIVEILFKGQKEFGFIGSESKKLLEHSILTRDFREYQKMARCLSEQDILSHREDLKEYFISSLYSLINIILNNEEINDTLTKYLNSEKKGIRNGNITGINKNGYANALWAIQKQDRKKFLREILDILTHRHRTYKREKSLPYFRFPSYLLFLAKDKDMEIDVKIEIPKKYHLIIPDVLYFK